MSGDGGTRAVLAELEALRDEVAGEGRARYEAARATLRALRTW